jgi:hypothetical protein
MALLQVRAILENGQLHLLDPLNFPDGQKLVMRIEAVNEFDTVKLALGDLVVWGDDSLPEDDMDEEALSREIQEAFKGDKPLSEIIIEDRGEA